MNADQFPAAAAQLAEWVASYRRDIRARPVTPSTRPGDVRALLPAHAPERPEAIEAILADLDRIIAPHLLHWQHPRFMGYFPANADLSSVLGDLVSGGLGVQGMLWSTSPACTELETHILDWFVELFGLPATFTSSGTGGGVFQDSASSAALCALVAARERATSGHTNARGLAEQGARLGVYTSAHAHSSIEKAVRIAGLGSAAIRQIDTDDALALRPDALARAMTDDVASGVTPCFVVATLGTTSTLAFDPLPAIATHCATHGAWLHVDAALAGCAAICEEHRWMHVGLEHADSYCTNLHKWLGVAFDCDLFYVRDRRALIGALGIEPEYLANAATASGSVIDYRDWQIPLGRRFRALKPWLLLRLEGADAIRSRIRSSCQLAQRLLEQLQQDAAIECWSPQRLGLVCIRSLHGDRATARILEQVNRDGAFMATHTKVPWRGDRTPSLTVRLSVGHPDTSAADIDALTARIREAALPRPD